jgi:DNA-binding NarL/FixJ family response regulator
MKPAPEKIRVILVDDHELVREGLRLMLSRSDGVDVVGLAASGEEALERVNEVDADVLLLDMRLPGIHGLDVIASLTKAGRTRPRILVLSAHDDQEVVLEAVRAGAHGYILKSATRNELIGAIRRVAAGERYYDAVVVKAFLRGDQRERDARLLTTREREILRLAADGFTNKAIGERIFLSTGTVKTHLDNIYRKLEVSDRAHAVAVALRRGLLD